MKHLDDPVGGGGDDIYRGDIDQAPAGDRAGLLPRITLRGEGRGLLICIGAFGFGLRGGAGDPAAQPTTIGDGS